MPIIEVHLLEGRTVEQKRELAGQLTDAVCRTLGTRPEQVRIILSEMRKEDYAIAGRLVCDGN
ncbi:MAG: 2-hydroxymuconate tautomerase family protein [Synergistaceae bacterium]|jgi:4-oxalocrotonate tautomerase|nr:2-hydroxymuconate tautomerase family protein [Synergistaceae bacterium]